MLLVHHTASQVLLELCWQLSRLSPGNGEQQGTGSGQRQDKNSLLLYSGILVKGLSARGRVPSASSARASKQLHQDNRNTPCQVAVRVMRSYSAAQSCGDTAAHITLPSAVDHCAETFLNHCAIKVSPQDSSGPLVQWHHLLPHCCHV
jgi:hypothetical protein